MTVRSSWAVGSDTERINTAEDARAGIAALLAPTGYAGARAGFRPASDWGMGAVTATSPTADTFVHVAPFQYFLPSSRGAAKPYILTLDAIYDIDMLTGHPADPSNARHDLIVAQQYDKTYGDADSLLHVRQVVGTPSGTPTDPDPTAGGTLSPDYITLARVTVPAGATTITVADITDLRSTLPITAAVGGLIPVASQAARNAIVTPYDGMPVWRIDTKEIDIYTGGAWTPAAFLGAGARLAKYTAAINATGANQVLNGNASTTIQFANPRRPSSFVTASGTNNTTFTLLKGDYSFKWGARVNGGIGNPPDIFIQLVRNDTGEIISAKYIGQVPANKIWDYTGAGDDYFATDGISVSLNIITANTPNSTKIDSGAVSTGLRTFLAIRWEGP